MKMVNTLTAFVLILFAFSFIGESYYWYMEGFESEYATATFYLQEGTSQQEMKDDFVKQAELLGVEVFVKDRQLKSVHEETDKIYSTGNANERLREKFSINGNKISSLILGQMDIEFHDFQEIPDISKIESFYFIGDFKQVEKFKEKLIDKYAGSFPQRGYLSLNPVTSPILIWSIVFLLLLLLSLYRVALLKKEFMIRVISGENTLLLVMKEALFDTGRVIALFFVALLIVRNFTRADFELKISIALLVAFSIMNMLVYMWLLFSNYKRDLGSQKSAQRVLKISYGYKVVSLFIVVILISGSLELLHESVRYYSQHTFFDQYNQYSFLMLAEKGGLFFEDDENSEHDGLNEDEIEALRQSQYNDYTNEGKALSLVDIESANNPNVIYANRGARKYLQSNIPTLRQVDLEDKVYCLIPQKVKRDEGMLANCESILALYIPPDTEVEYIPYHENVDIIALRMPSGDFSFLRKNPVILFDNTKKPGGVFDDLYLVQSSLFDISDEALEKCIQDNGLENDIAYKTNARAAYMARLTLYIRSLLMSLFLFFVICLIEIFIVTNLLRYEFHVNAKQLVLLKISGHTLLHRYKRLLLNTVATACVGTGIATVLAILFWHVPIPFVILGGLFILGIELVFIVFQIRRIEKISMQRILKGGL